MVHFAPSAANAETGRARLPTLSRPRCCVGVVAYALGWEVRSLGKWGMVTGPQLGLMQRSTEMEVSFVPARLATEDEERELEEALTSLRRFSTRTLLVAPQAAANEVVAAVTAIVEEGHVSADSRTTLAMALDHFLNALPIFRTRLLEATASEDAQIEERIRRALDYEYNAPFPGAYRLLWELRNASQHSFSAIEVVSVKGLMTADGVHPGLELSLKGWRERVAVLPVALTPLSESVELLDAIGHFLDFADDIYSYVIECVSPILDHAIEAIFRYASEALAAPVTLPGATVSPVMWWASEETAAGEARFQVLGIDTSAAGDMAITTDRVRLRTGRTPRWGLDPDLLAASAYWDPASRRVKEVG